jgi:DNA-binding LytR/AlgR family response regulator
VPAALLTFAARALILRFILRLPAWPQLGANIIVGGLFSLLWYWLLMVMIGLASGPGFTTFRVEPWFNPAAFAWQLLQGAAVYAVIFAVVARRAERAAAAADGDMEPSPPPMSAEPAAKLNKERLDRYFIKRGEDILPVDVEAIISIEGADDYAEVRASNGRHLVRLTLSELEQSLDPERFIRVHRSRIVNLKRIERVEPAGGGRMLLHMENGESIQTSRAGTRLIRERVI